MGMDHHVSTHINSYFGIYTGRPDLEDMLKLTAEYQDVSSRVEKAQHYVRNYRGHLIHIVLHA